jgi:hypothetical protein
MKYKLEIKCSAVSRPWQTAQRQRVALRTTTVWRFRAEEPPFSQIAKVICGRAIVSVHMCPVSTPSLRSVGHSPQVHGTQAQIYLATSQYLYVVQNATRKAKGTAARPGQLKT